MLGFMIFLGFGVLALLFVQTMDVECLNKPRRNQTGPGPSWKPVTATRVAPVKSGANWQEDRLAPLAQR